MKQWEIEWIDAIERERHHERIRGRYGSKQWWTGDAKGRQVVEIITEDRLKLSVSVYSSYAFEPLDFHPFDTLPKLRILFEGKWGVRVGNDIGFSGWSSVFVTYLRALEAMRSFHLNKQSNLEFEGTAKWKTLWKEDNERNGTEKKPSTDLWACWNEAKEPMVNLYLNRNRQVRAK